MTQLTDTGLIVSRLDERIADLTTQFQGIFGATIVLDPDTVDGQTLGIFAESINNLDMLLGQIYGMLDPNTATGAALQRLVQLNGITQLPGSYSTVTLTLGGTVGTPINAGALFHSTATNATFATDVNVTIPMSGLIDVAATAAVIGAQAAPAGTITAIDTPVFGLQTVTNAAEAILGRDVETDGQLRARRSQSVAYPSQTIRDGIYAAIANLSGVLHAKVYENDQPVVDPVTGQAANSIYAVVDGGADQDIRDAILLKKTGGIPTLGTVAGNATDSQGNVHLINFDRPTFTSIYVVVNVSARPGWPVDGDVQMQNAVVEWAAAHYDIGQEVIQGDIYEPLLTVPGRSITSVFIGLAPAPTLSANIPIAYNALADFDISRITVNVT